MPFPRWHVQKRASDRSRHGCANVQTADGLAAACRRAGRAVAGGAGAERPGLFPPQRPVPLEKMRGVVLHRNDERQIERMIVRGAKLDSQLGAAAKELAGLRELELHDSELSAQAWRDLSALRELRRLGLFNTPADFAVLHRMMADHPQLTVDPWPVAFSTWKGGLVVDFPWVRLAFPELLPRPAIESSWPWRPRPRTGSRPGYLCCRCCRCSLPRRLRSRGSSL